MRSSFPSPLSVPSLYGSAKAFGTLRAASFSFAAGFTAPVVSVLDGDTIEVLHNNKAEPIRHGGIDCPEKRQAYGQKAMDAVADLAFRKEVTVKTHGLDKYGRTLADVLLSDGINANHELVKEGWC